MKKRISRWKCWVWSSFVWKLDKWGPFYYIHSAKFLIDVLKNNLANSPFYTEVLPKGIRSNYFYITDTAKCPMSHITADDNGAYVKTRNTNKLYCEVGENAHTVHMYDHQYFYNTRIWNTYARSYVSINDVIMLRRSYYFSKSLLLSRTIVSFASPMDGPNIPYVVQALLSNFEWRFSENWKTSKNRNASKGCLW